MKKILITAALPYANGPIHFGHLAGAYLPSDIYARFQRLKNNDVLFVSGSDEYGVAITMSAELAKTTPQDHVDKFHKINKEIFSRFSISFDHYSRTTWPGHKSSVYQYFNDLMDNGFIDERETEQLYSEQDQKFLADRYVVGICPRCGFDNARGDECTNCAASYEATDLKSPRSKITGAPLVLRKTRHMFLRLDMFKEKLLTWLSQKDWKANVVNYLRSYIQDLRPRAITRDMSWGIPVPLQEANGKVFYVWFDAPIGYISATKEWAELKGKPDLWKEYWQDPKTELIHFVGKDNIPFHGAIFPAMTMGQNLPFKLVDQLPANEFLNLEGRQFSKSDGWTIDIEEVLKNFSVDQLRYVLSANAPENQDAEFSWKDFQVRCNSELLGKFGNFINRTLVFIQNNCHGKVPAPEILDQVDLDFQENMISLTKNIEDAYEKFSPRRASQTLMDLAQLANVYFDMKKPWLDAKPDGNSERMQTTLYLCLECVKALGFSAFPILPNTSKKIWKMLSMDKPIEECSWDELFLIEIDPDKKLPKPELLFSKIEDDQIEKEQEKLLKSSQSKKEEKKQTSGTAISIDDFRKVELCIGQVLSCEPVPKSKKLFKLEVDIGSEKRSIVSGIAEHYAPEDLVGKHVVVVANLKPATLMGTQSHGMLLCASTQNNLVVLECPAPPGSKIS